MSVINTTVSSAEIYFNTAKVQREGKVEIHKGRNQFSIKGLPASADQQTVRVVVWGCPINGTMNIRNAAIDDEQNDSDKKEDKENISTKIGALNERKNRNLQIKDLYLHNADMKNLTNLNLNDIVSFLQITEEKIKSIDEENREIDLEINSLKKESQHSLTSLIEKNKKELIVDMDLRTDREGIYSVYLEYMDRSIYWDPYYEISSGGVYQPIVFKLHANIKQNTEEDWKDVKLKLHTGHPMQTIGNPLQLPVWHIGIRNPYYSKSSQRDDIPLPLDLNMPSIANEGTTVLDALMQEDRRYEPGMDVSVEQNSLVMTYEVQGEWNVPHGGNGTKINIQTLQMDAKYSYMTIPKNECAAYLTAIIENPPYDALLPAKAEIFLENIFRGSFKLDPDRNKPQITISFGRDENIIVERKSITSDDTSMLLKGSMKKHFEYKILVRNMRDNPAKVVVLDQIPLSKDKNVIVEKKELMNGRLNEQTGEIRWTLDLNPRYQSEITLAFNVIYPKGTNLNI